MKYWFQGQPFAGVSSSGNDPGTMKYWFQGLPQAWLTLISAADRRKFFFRSFP